MKILESSENYLEAIKFLSEKNDRVRAVDVASYLSFSRPSVSIALKQLKEHEYIQITKEGNIYLSEKGKVIANEMYERHSMLTLFLIALGVSEDTAKKDACKIEHHISKETYEKIKEHCLPKINGQSNRMD